MDLYRKGIPGMKIWYAPGVREEINQSPSLSFSAYYLVNLSAPYVIMNAEQLHAVNEGKCDDLLASLKKED